MCMRLRLAFLQVASQQYAAQHLGTLSVNYATSTAACLTLAASNAPLT